MGQKMKYAIVGSRDWPNEELVVDFVKSLKKSDVIISGGAKGPDTWAVNAAKQLGLETVVHKADWDKLGRAAGMIRNKDIVNDCDKLVAFWDEVSRGTKHSIGLAEKQGKLLRIYTIADKSI
jgi:hypothetical protein